MGQVVYFITGRTVATVVGAAIAIVAIADPGLAANQSRGRTAMGAELSHCNSSVQRCVSGTTPYNVDTEPPSAADRGGLLRAFHGAHRDRRNLALVGFRVVGPHSAAAYYLITGPDRSTYVAGYTDLFRRTHGHSWVHVKRIKNANPGWNDVDNLDPGFLWKATSDGSGTYVYQETQAANDGSFIRTYHTQANFRWNFTYANGRVLNLEDDTATAKRSLAGQMSASFTESDEPSQNASCSGSVTDRGGGSQAPDLNLAGYPRGGRTRAFDFRLDLVDQLSWPSSCNSDWTRIPEDNRFEVGARVPLAVLERKGFISPGGLQALPRLNGQSFNLPVDDLAPMVVKDAKPHQSASENDGTAQTTDSEDLKLAGTLHFKLVGLYMPLGWLGTPRPPLRVDGHVPPVL